MSLLAICFGSAYKKELTARAGSLSTHTDFGLYVGHRKKKDIKTFEVDSFFVEVWNRTRFTKRGSLKADIASFFLVSYVVGD